MTLKHESPISSTIHPSPVVSRVPEVRLRKNLPNIDSTTRDGFFLDFQLPHLRLILNFRLIHLQENPILHGTVSSYYKSSEQQVPLHASLPHNCKMPRPSRSTQSSAIPPSRTTRISSTAPSRSASLSAASTAPSRSASLSAAGMSGAPDTVVIDDDSTAEDSGPEKSISPGDVLGKQQSWLIQ